MRVSQTILALFAESGTTQYSVKELADHSGVSERTFYRYFPRKEDVVRPALTAGAHQFTALVAGRPRSEPVLDALKAAFALSRWGESTQYSQTLRRLMRETDVWRTIWLDIVSETESRLADALALRLGVEFGASKARLMSSVVCAVIRTSATVCMGSDPHALADAFAQDLDGVASGLFDPVPEKS